MSTTKKTEPGASSIVAPKTAIGQSNKFGFGLSQQSTIAGGLDNNIPSERDLQATKTFAVLRMLEPGDNPWDLGSFLLNWKTVMGNHVIDWVLPIRRSPCCNHEESESHFSVGPWVDLLRVNYGFLEPGNIRGEGGKRFQRRTGLSPDLNKAKTKATKGRPNNPIKLRNLNSHTPQLTAEPERSGGH
jgi:palmitoyltransferase